MKSKRSLLREKEIDKSMIQMREKERDREKEMNKERERKRKRKRKIVRERD